MQFRGTFSRGGKSYPVSGDVSGGAGTFAYAIPKDATSIGPGAGMIRTDKGEIWQIKISALHGTGDSEQPMCEFQIVSRAP